MGYSSEVDALVGVAVRHYCVQRYYPKHSPNKQSRLGVKQFQKEFPTPEAQWAFVQSFIDRGKVPQISQNSEEKQVIAALGFWFDVIWPNLPEIRSHEDYREFVDSTSEPIFSTGQLINHVLYGYRGVVVEVDTTFSNSDEWYETMAKSRPPKNRPWYHILVDQTETVTYVAERHLVADTRLAPIDHPLLEQYFSHFNDGRYWMSPIS